MSIFESSEPTGKSELERMDINTFVVKKSNGNWVFEKDGSFYSFAPPMFAEMTLSPVIFGADKLINYGCKFKGMVGYEDGFNLLVSSSYFPACDIRLTYAEPFYDGWIYEVDGENLKGFMEQQKTWMCPYLKMYYDKPPFKLYLKMESIPENGAPV